MQFVKRTVLILAMAAISFGAQSSFAQQEIDPDHYDQPMSAKAPAQKSPAGHKKEGKANVASQSAKHHPAHHNALTSHATDQVPA
jgi:hypothetical protein